MPTTGARLLDGSLASALQLAAAEFAAARTGGRSPLTGVGRALIDLTPGPMVDMVVATVESADKPLLRATVAGGWLATGAAAAVRPRRLRHDPRLLLGAVAGIAAASRRDAATGGSLLAAAGGSMAAATAQGALSRHPNGSTRGATGAAALALLAAAARSRSRARARAEATRRTSVVNVKPPGPVDGGFDGLPGISPLFTPPERFYVTDVAFDPVPVDLDRWRLRIGGMVDRAMELSFDELLAMDPIELDATLVCVHNPVGGPRIGSARWFGVPLVSLLRRAGIQPDAEQIVARSVDGFTAGIPVSRIGAPEDAIVALAMNGQALPFANGYPARLLTPGLWGADANTKWLCELELTTWGAVRDYWDRRGWPRQPSAVRPGSRIDVPRNRAVVSSGDTTIAGVAWAPAQGVEAVELSIDGGPWQEAEMSVELAPTFWRQWRLDWPASAGAHSISVRTRGRATMQNEHRQPPYPVGSSGFHTIRVEVLAGAPPFGARLASRVRYGIDDVEARGLLAVDGARAWRNRGYPPAPRWPTPRSVARRDTASP